MTSIIIIIILLNNNDHVHMLSLLIRIFGSDIVYTSLPLLCLQA